MFLFEESEPVHPCDSVIVGVVIIWDIRATVSLDSAIYEILLVVLFYPKHLSMEAHDLVSGKHEVIGHIVCLVIYHAAEVELKLSRDEVHDRHLLPVNVGKALALLGNYDSIIL